MDSKFQLHTIFESNEFQERGNFGKAEQKDETPKTKVALE
jgi:hypothetical protein